MGKYSFLSEESLAFLIFYGTSNVRKVQGRKPALRFAGKME